MRFAVMLTAGVQHLAYLDPASGKRKLEILAAWVVLWATPAV